MGGRTLTPSGRVLWGQGLAHFHGSRALLPLYSQRWNEFVPPPPPCRSCAVFLNLRQHPLLSQLFLCYLVGTDTSWPHWGLLPSWWPGTFPGRWLQGHHTRSQTKVLVFSGNESYAVFRFQNEQTHRRRETRGHSPLPLKFFELKYSGTCARWCATVWVLTGVSCCLPAAVPCLLPLLTKPSCPCISWQLLKCLQFCVFPEHSIRGGLWHVAFQSGFLPFRGHLRFVLVLRASRASIVLLCAPVAVCSSHAQRRDLWITSGFWR